MSFRTQLGTLGNRRYFARRAWLDRAAARSRQHAAARARIARDIAAAAPSLSPLRFRGEGQGEVSPNSATLQSEN